jgi:RNA polymerase sigma factor (sigma-70 family)
MGSEQELAFVMEEAIWSVPDQHLEPAEPFLRAFVAAAGFGLPSVLVEMADETLARAVQNNLLRGPAFEEWVVRRYEPALRQWFYRRTNSLDRAADLVQELYLKLLTPRVLASYNPDYPFPPWLWRVVQRFWIDELRQGSPPLQRLPPDQAGYQPEPADEVAALELRGQLETAVTILPLMQRRVFLLALQGSDAGQIAHSLELPKSKVYRLLFHARRALEHDLVPKQDP